MELGVLEKSKLVGNRGQLDPFFKKQRWVEKRKELNDDDKYVPFVVSAGPNSNGAFRCLTFNGDACPTRSCCKFTSKAKISCNYVRTLRHQAGRFETDISVLEEHNDMRGKAFTQQPAVDEDVVCLSGHTLRYSPIENASARGRRKEEGHFRVQREAWSVLKQFLVDSIFNYMMKHL